MMKTDTFFYSDIGGRSENEDSATIMEEPGKGCLAVVADGLGGHGGGAEASQVALQTVLELFAKTAVSMPQELLPWFEAANQAVCAMQTPKCRMKTTMVMLHIRDDMAMWAHVGDSRLYHFVNGRLVEQTVDHSVSQMAVFRGEITLREIRGHEDRNRLTSAIGKQGVVNAELSERVSLAGLNHAFLLCSDGFWEYVYEEEMEECLNSSRTAREWMEKMARCLISHAKPGHDNNSAAAILCRDK